jgi:predicted  nucleic acid-binding Zn-ribbon protein
MYRSFETEIQLRQQIAALQEKVAGLLDIQVSAERYREKLLGEFEQLEQQFENLKFAVVEQVPHDLTMSVFEAANVV